VLHLGLGTSAFGQGLNPTTTPLVAYTDNSIPRWAADFSTMCISTRLAITSISLTIYSRSAPPSRAICRSG